MNREMLEKAKRKAARDMGARDQGEVSDIRLMREEQELEKELAKWKDLDPEWYSRMSEALSRMMLDQRIPRERKTRVEKELAHRNENVVRRLLLEKKIAWQLG